MYTELTVIGQHILYTVTKESHTYTYMSDPSSLYIEVCMAFIIGERLPLYLHAYLNLLLHCTYVHMALVSFILSFLCSGAPQITVSAPTYVIQGDTLSVNCSVTSFPQSHVSLSLGDTPILTSVPGEYDSTAGSFTYFTTHSTTAVHPSDEGNYTCSAAITHGQPAVTEVFSGTAFVTVYGGSCSHAHYSTGGRSVVGTHTQ